MNAGEVLYSRDLVEINLPLIMQMSAIVVGVGDWLRIDALSLWRVTVGLLVVGGFTVSWRLLRSVLVEIPRETQAALALFFVAALVSLPGISFGQREHLVVLGFLPYIVGAGVRAHGRPLPSATAVLSGLSLAVGLAIKPHYVLAVPCVELVLGLYRRSWRQAVRVETMTAAAALLVLVADVVWRHPGYLEHSLPMALHYYTEYASATFKTTEACYLLLVLVAAAPGLPRSVAIFSRLFAVSAVGCYVGYQLQTGWAYQFLPTAVLSALAFGLPATTVGTAVLRRLVTRWRAPLWPLCSAVGLTLLVVTVSVMTAARTERIIDGRRGYLVTGVRALVERSWPVGLPKTMAGVTRAMFPSFPVAELVGAGWGSRFSCLWLLPGIVAREQGVSSAQPDPARTFLESAVVEDFARWRPTIVLVEREELSILEEMLKARAFRTVWQSYRLAGSVEHIDVFVRDAPAASDREAGP